MYLGQHFLINIDAIARIISTPKLEAGDLVVELGPGTGALTYPLLEECKKAGATLVAIEKDRNLALKLYQSIQKKESSFEVRDKDLLKELPKLMEEKSPKRYHIVGNLPYYISGKILRTITDLQNKPETAVLMLQKEVAQRICNKKKLSLIAASVQVWADTEIVMNLSENDFDPAPKVKSAVIKLTKKEKMPEVDQSYFDFLKASFKQPRKTLLNNLNQAGVEKQDAAKALKALKFEENVRASELTVEQLYELSKKLKLVNK
ncbi:MAG: 16S rRNA (adenine(1518)-N(6)/adenine(1519)-N(6))-dimethyltransferase RsmA [Candidatus Paceibacterota bacterium]